MGEEGKKRRAAASPIDEAATRVLVAPGRARGGCQTRRRLARGFPSPAAHEMGE